MFCLLVICFSAAIVQPAQVPVMEKVRAPKTEPHERVSWIISDNQGEIKGQNIHRTHKSASLTKAMIAVLYARQHSNNQSGDLNGLNRTIEIMLRSSDNAAANVMLSAVGGATKLDEFAKEIGMKDFRANGHWANADLSVYDQNIFWRDIEDLLPENHEAEIMGYLNSVVDYQWWGISKVAKERGWKVYQKAGWRSEGSVYRFNQAVRMCRKEMGCWNMVILTENMSSDRVAHYRAEEFARRNIPTRCHKELVGVDFQYKNYQLNIIGKMQWKCMV